jgi:hypothetical protein
MAAVPHCCDELVAVVAEFGGVLRCAQLEFALCRFRMLAVTVKYS